MHSIKNNSERNKIDTPSRADAYIKRKRLISTSDYNLKSGLDAPKSILETEKTLKTPSSGQIYEKKPKKPQKPKTNPKKPTGLVFFFIRVFSNHAQSCSRDGAPGRWCAGGTTAGDGREKSAKPPFFYNAI
jgi:hypothetical protein